MDKRFDREKIVNYFAMEGHKKVHGWLSSHTLSILYYLGQFQDELGIKGNVAEIGVFQGRFFIALCLMMRKGEKAVAIDVFEDQHLNIDKSGVGDLEKFTINIERELNSIADIEIIKSDSIKVTANQLLATAGDRIRLFSIDGCHTAEHTASDLRLAAQSLVPCGIVMLDDFENTSWPGVRQGVADYLKQDGDLRPFALAYNKLYLTTANSLAAYGRFAEETTRRSTSQIAYENVAGFNVPRVLLPAVESIFPELFMQSIDFSASASPEKYLVCGWSGPEPWGIWSQQETAELSVPLDGAPQALVMTVTFHAFVTESHPEVQIDIYLDARLADSLLFRNGQDYHNWRHVLHPDKINWSSPLHIRFNILSPKSPFELGLSADQRKLGIGLRNIRFSKAS